jgi:hypothetical protein
MAVFAMVAVATSLMSSSLFAEGSQPAAKKEASVRQNNPPKQQYTIDQAISDKAQLYTISFSGLAFLTGDFGASTFIPPGKVADYFGFQYMRDIDATQKGHNPLFLNRVAGNVLKTLTPSQKQQFLNLAIEQTPQLEALAEMRLPLIKAFHQAADTELPSDRNGLSQTAVKNHVADIFELDARLSLRRAEVMASVARSFTEEQKAFFNIMQFGNFESWPDVNEATKKTLKQDTRNQPKLVGVAYMTYASEFFSWYAGSIEADTYFCPERHGTYFGGFYMKDMPAMGQGDYDIPLEITGDSGAEMLTILTSEQAALITAIPDKQRKLLEEIIEIRRTISEQLRLYLEGTEPDEEKVLELGRRYGELDGEMSFHYASAFAQIKPELSEAQFKELMLLRNLPGFESAPYYQFSQAMNTEPVSMITDPFFSQNSEVPLK